MQARPLKSEFLSNFIFALGYALAFQLLQLFLHKAGMVPAVADAQNLAVWDADWYKSIAEHGYEYKAEGSSNSGFFIFVPAVWKLLHLNALSMSWLNIVFFSAGFGLLTRQLRLDRMEQLLWLTTPALYFCFVPYSEAAFFLFAALLVCGISEGRVWMIWLSLFLISQVRATTLFLAPALLVMELLSRPGRELFESLRRWILRYLIPMALGLGAFVWYQYHKTGIWFAYFKTQSTNWGRKFSWPVLPFSSEHGDRTIWYGALAMFFCLIAFVIMLGAALRWLRRQRSGYEPLQVLSFSYLAITLCIIVLFNPTWGTNTTLIIGMHRYALVNPFFFIALYHFTKERNYRWLDYVIAAVLANLVWIACGAYVHLQQMIFFNFNLGCVLLYMIYRKQDWALPVLCAVNLVLQVHFYQQYLAGLYPDG